MSGDIGRSAVDGCEFSPPPLEDGDPGWTAAPEQTEVVDLIQFNPSFANDAGDDTYHQRRDDQRRKNSEIGEGSNEVPKAAIFTVSEMLEKFVFIQDGSQVAPIDRPRAVLKLSEFRNAVAASKHMRIDKDSGKEKLIPASLVWLENKDRQDAEALTFRAGAPRMTQAPETGKLALNLWREPQRDNAPADWLHRASLFVDHVRWLWGNDAESFLDWLAHIEQRPGVLPHFGWVHISREHGKGRNWISSVLTRVWREHVAASLDLISILDGGFNGRMSQKVLAIVDEINEGGGSSYKHEQRLRALVTEESRLINPKYGHQRVEWNACRWLMFSNHTGAIPISEDDRRFWIVSHQGSAHPPSYYENLYGKVDDPLFISSVAEFLRQRSIANFKPGQRPPMNEAKAELVSFSQSEDDATLKEVASQWPVDLITAEEISNLLEQGGPASPAVRHGLDRAGIRKLAGKVRVTNKPLRVYAIRDYSRWAAAPHHEKKAEIERLSEDDKREVIGLPILWNS